MQDDVIPTLVSPVEGSSLGYSMRQFVSTLNSAFSANTRTVLSSVLNECVSLSAVGTRA